MGGGCPHYANAFAMYELHHQMITFGKVYLRSDPNGNACPMRGDSLHYANALAMCKLHYQMITSGKVCSSLFHDSSYELALPGAEESRVVSSTAPVSTANLSGLTINPILLPSSEVKWETGTEFTRNSEILIGEPTTPEPLLSEALNEDIEDAFYEYPDVIPTIDLNVEEFTTNLQSFMEGKMEIGEDMSKALVAWSPKFASKPVPKLKHISQIWTEHQVYELPDSNPLLRGMNRREPDDPSPYLLAIWAPGETADSVKAPENISSSSQGEHAQIVRGTILVPCRTALSGSFTLNGTYFQVNEVFADHETSLNPVDVPRSMLWNLPRRTVFFGTSASTTFEGINTEGIEYCFLKGLVCVRGFDQKTRAPKPLSPTLLYNASKIGMQNEHKAKQLASEVASSKM